MLAWSPQDLDNIFNVVVTNFQMSARNSQPANTLYLMARFACLTCDATWLEDLILGATDVIEERFFVSAICNSLLQLLDVHAEPLGRHHLLNLLVV
jgi:hypothetical protein